MAKIDDLLNNIPDAYDKEETSFLYKILSVIGSELDKFMDDMDYVDKAKYVTEANGTDLDKLGKLLAVKRFSGENDLTYRGRIQSKVPSFIGGGTLEAIKSTVKNVLGVEPMIFEHYKPGNGHASFDKGVWSGYNTVMSTGLNVTVQPGIAYIGGNKIEKTADVPITLTASTTSYIKLNMTSGNLSVATNSDILTNQILISSVVTSSTGVTSITDGRTILDPSVHYITNTASITVQIPYDFKEDLISLEDTINIVKEIKAAGVALLIRALESHKESVTITDKAFTNFLVGFSGMGSDSLLGGA